MPLFGLAALLALLLVPSGAALALDEAEGLQRLVAAYPEHLAGAEPNVLVWKDGERMIYDDGRPKSFEVMLVEADLQDMMSIPYPSGRDYPQPLPENFDPGRIRCEAFFRKMYGNSAAEVQNRLTTIIWLPGSARIPLRISTVNNVHQRLLAVSRDIEALPPALQVCAKKTAGTFVWRMIRGTNQLSQHSFGTAIDLSQDCANYWQWDLPRLRYRNRMPLEIVEAFERHGFIWGGKWYHYDTMHFEYRPELLPPASTP